MKNDTKVILSQINQSQFRENSTPIYITSSFSYDSAEQARDMFADKLEGNIYSRFSNPNNSDLIEKMKLLEGAEYGLTTASGMAAIFSVFASLLCQGDHFVTPNGLFGSTHQVVTKILPKFGIQHDYLDMNDLNLWAEKIKPNTKLLFLETPTNPGLQIVDLIKAKEFCIKYKLLLVVDNTFTTPILQKPIEYGADIVIHSATKFLDGQGRTLGGLVLGKKDLLEPVRFFLRQTGPSLSAIDAWFISKSIETLKLRVERQSENAFKIAKYFEHHRAVNRILYPFLESHPNYKIAKSQMVMGGSIICVYLKSDINGTFKFLNNLTHITQTANLGDVKTLITHPFTTTHSKLTDGEKHSMNITENMVRISVGIEDVDDLIQDIESSLYTI